MNRTALQTMIPTLTAVAAAAALVACGSRSGPDDQGPAAPVTITGSAAVGLLQGATACYDLDDNAACDAGEPNATTAADGRFSLSVDAAQAGRHALVVQVPLTAVDRDTGAAVGTAFTLSAPASGKSGPHDVFVSPLTTAVMDLAAATGSSMADAESEVKSRLGLAQSPLADYVAGADAQAARLARTVNAVAVESTRLAAAASVPADATRALVASASSGHLAMVGALVQGSKATTPAALAAEVSTLVLEVRHLNAGSVEAQAQAALAVAGPQPVAAPGPFVSPRRFTWADAGNYNLFAFVGNSTPDADGRYWASEVRLNQLAGKAQPFNRNTAYLNRASGQWQVCDNAWNTVYTRPASGMQPQESLYCAGQLSRTRLAEVDVSGSRMADIVAAVRAWPLRDSVGADTDETGLPVRWGPDPAALGSATFPAGSIFTRREQTTDLGDTERYSLTDKPRVVPAGGSGTFRHAASFTDLKRMSGNLVDDAAVVTSLNTVFLDDRPAAPADATLSPVKRYRIGFDPAGDAVRYYACDVLKSNNGSLNCTTLGDGSSSITVLADSRVLRLGAGYPQALTLAFARQRLFVERSGAVFGGNRDLERKVFQQRPNTVAFDALRSALAMPALQTPAAPAAAGPGATLRSFTFSDADNYTLRAFKFDNSQTDANGYFSANEVRAIRSGGNDIDFARNRLYWTGSDWYDCPSDGVGVLVAKASAPFDSLFCKTYLDQRLSNAVVTLDGRNIADVVRDIRLYSSKDFGFDYAGWGPNPDAHSGLANAVFPPGSTVEYRGTQRKATPVAIATAAGDQVRVPPADASVPFNTWPFAASLDEFIAKYPGDLAGTALNGSTAVFVWSVNLPAAPGPEYTTQMEIRVSFDTLGQKARFYRNYRLKSNNTTTAYARLIDTTYSIETLGGVRVLKFAALPEGFERDYGFARMFAERVGGVWYAFKDFVAAAPGYSIRLNGVATEALMTALAIN